METLLTEFILTVVAVALGWFLGEVTQRIFFEWWDNRGWVPCKHLDCQFKVKSTHYEVIDALMWDHEQKFHAGS